MRDFILLYVNGTEHRVHNDSAFSRLSDYLRQQLRLTGTKVACSEGGCGSCTVLVGRPAGQGLEYHTVNACIQFVYQLDASHVVTIEGLTTSGCARAVQSALIQGHAIQCGFCTAGFVASLTGMFELERRARPGRSEPFQPSELQRGLTGNLCRCTGYQQLLEAGASIAPPAVVPLQEGFSDRTLTETLRRAASDAVQLETPGRHRPRRLFRPTTLRDATALRSSLLRSTVVGGATRIALEQRSEEGSDQVLLDLGNVASLAEIDHDDLALTVGALAPWARISTSLQTRVPEATSLLARFASPQVRNVASIGGHLADASPIADMVPMLMVLGATADLAASTDTQAIQVGDSGWSESLSDFASSALIARVRIPFPRDGANLRCYKISKRPHLDLATLNAAILVEADNGGITTARVAVGGAGRHVQRLPRAEAALVGKPVTEETFRAAALAAQREIQPIDDVRGSAAYRRLLAGNLFLKFFHEVSV